MANYHVCSFLGENKLDLEKLTEKTLSEFKIRKKQISDKMNKIGYVTTLGLMISCGIIHNLNHPKIILQDLKHYATIGLIGVAGGVLTELARRYTVNKVYELSKLEQDKDLELSKIKQELLEKESMLNTAGISIIKMDKDLKITWVNEPYQKRSNKNRLDLGKEKIVDLVGLNYKDFHNEKYTKMLQDVVNEVLANGGISAYDFKDIGGKSFFRTVSQTLNLNGELKEFVAFSKDITIAKENEKKLRIYFEAFKNMPGPVLVTDSKGNIIDANPYFEDASGYTKEEVIGRNPRFLKSGKHDDGFYEEVWSTILKGKIHQSVWTNKKKNGHSYVENKTIIPIFDDKKELINYISIGLDLTKIYEYAYKDYVTGLSNRRHFMDHLFNQVHMIRRKITHKETPYLGIVHIDLDHFKKINDTYGHKAGDDVLKQYGARLKGCFRPYDIVARTGGDEFHVLMPGVGNIKEGTEKIKQEIGNKILKSVLKISETPYETDGQKIFLKSSLGAYFVPEFDEFKEDRGDINLDYIMKKADLPLLRAKDDGKGRFEFYNPDLDKI